MERSEESVTRTTRVTETHKRTETEKQAGWCGMGDIQVLFITRTDFRDS